MIVAILVASMGLLLASSCSSSGSGGGGEVCDNGGGGITASLCATYAKQGKCTSQKVTMTPGHPCTMFPDITVTPACCVVDGCSGGDMSFLDQSPSAFPPGPTCSPTDAGGGG